MTTFAELDLIEPLQRAVEAAGYTRPTPIQVQAIPPLLAGRDVIGCAQTGTGKTAAFALPILQLLARAATPARTGRRPIRALVLSPTRELAAQIGDSFTDYGKYLRLRHAVIFGGVGQNPQVAALEQGLDVLVATPGRLLDLKNQGYLDLSQLEFFVLDEADRMLDMGFIHDIRKVLAVLPARRQNLLFSATMPAEILQLANSFLRDPVQVSVTPQATPVERIEQRLMYVEKADKPRLLARLLGDPEVERAIVFTRTKHGANRLVKQLQVGGINAAAIHGNKSQNARLRALDEFKDGATPVLVATDLASRGLDVDGVSHVFNFDLPNEPESYVHRIGRTGRAGRGGVSISFCDESEAEFLRDIERLIQAAVPVDEDQPFHAARLVPVANPARGRGKPAARPAAPRPAPAPRANPAPRAETPRAEAPRAEARPPRSEPPRTEAPRTETPRAEVPRAEAPRTPRADAPRADAPRSAPRPDGRRPSAQAVTQAVARALGQPAAVAAPSEVSAPSEATRRRRRRRRGPRPGAPD